MKTTVSIIAACMLVAAIVLNKHIIDGKNNSLSNNSEANCKMQSGMYSATEFLQFKNEKLIQKLYAQKGLSDRVLFHKFLVVKKAAGCK